MWCRAAILLIAVAGAAQASVPAQETIYNGPMHFCGAHFAIDLKQGELVGFRLGPDFNLFRFSGPNGGSGIYEGFAPDIFENTQSKVTLPDGREVTRLQNRSGSFSYLFNFTEAGRQSFVHLYGMAWKGNDTDIELLERINTGSAQSLNCPKPTVNE